MPQLDITTYTSQLFWLCICFFSMYFIMAKIIIPRIADIIDQRQSKIDDYINKAMEIKKQAEESLEKYQNALAQATSEADKSLNKTQEELNALIAKRQEELDKKLREKITSSEAQITKSKEQALQQLHEISENLALEIVKKIGLTEIKPQNIKAAIKKVETK